MDEVNFDWKGYLKPTPKLIRKIGWALFTLWESVAGILLTNEHTTASMIVAIIGALGLGAQVFFTDKVPTRPSK